MTLRMGVGFPTGREGLNYPVPFCGPADLVEIARRAETLGFDSLGGNDHVVAAEYVLEAWDDPPRYYEVFTTLAHVAAVTEEITLNTSVAVLPFRDPVWLAKQAATLDQLSEGRLLLGVGVGAYREEFDAIRPEVRGPRGAITDECLEALSMLLAGPASYDGEYVHFEGVDLHPRPVQEPLPIYVGGNHPNAVERAVRWGQGWLPAGLSPAELAGRIDLLAQLCEEHDRNPGELDVAPQLTLCVAEDADAARRKFRSSHQYTHLRSLAESTLKGQSVDDDDLVEGNLVGTPDEITQRLEAYLDVGVDHFPGTVFAVNDVEELHADMALVSEAILDRF